MAETFKNTTPFSVSTSDKPRTPAKQGSVGSASERLPVESRHPTCSEAPKGDISFGYTDSGTSGDGKTTRTPSQPKFS